MTRPDNIKWISSEGLHVDKKLARSTLQDLPARDQLIHWLWWADYMMCNAGDFANAVALERDFQVEAARLATQLRLPYTAETFSLERSKLQSEYFDRIDRVCDEIRHT